LAPSGPDRPPQVRRPRITAGALGRPRAAAHRRPQAAEQAAQPPRFVRARVRLLAGALCRPLGACAALRLPRQRRAGRRRRRGRRVRGVQTRRGALGAAAQPGGERPAQRRRRDGRRGARRVQRQRGALPRGQGGDLLVRPAVQRTGSHRTLRLHARVTSTEQGVRKAIPASPLDIGPQDRSTQAHAVRGGAEVAGEAKVHARHWDMQTHQAYWRQ